MSLLKKYITNETLITCAPPSDFFEAIGDKGRTIYYKSFNINEFIGQQLSSIRNLKSNKYFLMKLDCEYKVNRYKDMNCHDIENIKIASYDFKKYENRYYSLNELKREKKELEELLKLCPNEKNKEQLTNEILELFALDTYMGQTDRAGHNIMFEVNNLDEMHLCPIYDYEYSMNSIYNETNRIYPNAICELESLYEYKKLLSKYPQLYEMLSTYLNINIEEEIINCFHYRRLNHNKINLKKYVKFSEERCKIIRKILQ